MMPAPNQWQLSPAYDLTPTPELAEHSLSINGKWSAIDDLDLLEVAQQFSVRDPKNIIAAITAPARAQDAC